MTIWMHLLAIFVGVLLGLGLLTLSVVIYMWGAMLAMRFSQTNLGKWLMPDES